MAPGSTKPCLRKFSALRVGDVPREWLERSPNPWINKTTPFLAGKCHKTQTWSCVPQRCVGGEVTVLLYLQWCSSNLYQDCTVVFFINFLLSVSKISIKIVSVGGLCIFLFLLFIQGRVGRESDVTPMFFNIHLKLYLMLSRVPAIAHYYSTANEYELLYRKKPSNQSEMRCGIAH